MISKIRYYVDEACLLKMYHSFVQSHIDYNLLNWSCTNKSFLKPIENKVKKGIRIISFPKTKYDHTAPLFKKHNILPFYDHICLKKALLMWKTAHGYSPSVINHLFTKNCIMNLNLCYPNQEKSMINFFLSIRQ